MSSCEHNALDYCCISTHSSLYAGIYWYMSLRSQRLFHLHQPDQTTMFRPFAQTIGQVIKVENKMIAPKLARNITYQ